MPLSFRVEGIELIGTGDRLLVVNKSMRRMFLGVVGVLVCSFLSAWISY